MCGHHILIELRPDPEDYKSWQELDSIDLGGGRKIPQAEQEWQQARELARTYALAHPHQAHTLVLNQYSCNGSERQEQPYAEGQVIQPTREDAQRLAEENLRLREALRFYADVRQWRARTHTNPQGEVTLSIPAASECGARARAALYGPLPTANQTLPLKDLI